MKLKQVNKTMATQYNSETIKTAENTTANFLFSYHNQSRAEC